MTELVSVVITAYNVDQFIAAAIESVLEQTHQHFEIILINDGSTDQTLSIMEEYQAKDTRIIIISNDKNLGIGYSANKGIELAKSEIIVRVDADDIMLPTRIEEQLKFLKENPQISMTSCHAHLINSKGELMNDTQVMAGFTKLEDTQHTLQQRKLISCAHTGFTAYKSAILEAGGYRNIPCVVDLDLFTRMAEKGHILLIMQKVLMKYRMHLSSVMAKSTKSFLLENTRDWVTDCMNRRLDGKPELSYQEYMKEYKKKPFLQRANKERLNMHKHYYRNAVVYFGYKKYLFFIYSYMMAFFYRPRHMFIVLLKQIYKRILKASFKAVFRKKVEKELVNTTY